MAATDLQTDLMRESARGSRTPLRGTQSFVSVMAQVWKRPSLTALELVWRWGAGLPLLLLLWTVGAHALRRIPFDLAALEAMTVFKPTEAVATVHRQLAVTLPPLVPVLRWWVPLALLLWAVASAIGRTAVWRRLDPRLRARYLLTGALGLLRSVALLGTLTLWLWSLLWASRYAVTGPASGGAEPNLVLFVALAVASSLLLFMAWSLGSWILDAAPLFAMSKEPATLQPSGTFLASIGAASKARALRPKLMETNLVMGIVKVALLVLAMVFSACPLPFASVETTAFLMGWWSFVGVLYLAFSDLFQVIRRAAYLRLFQALVTPETDMPPALRPAS